MRPPLFSANLKVFKQTFDVQGAPKKSFTSKTEVNKDAMKKAMRMNQLG